MEDRTDFDPWAPAPLNDGEPVQETPEDPEPTPDETPAPTPETEQPKAKTAKSSKKDEKPADSADDEIARQLAELDAARAEG